MPKNAIYIGPAPWAHDDSEGRARARPRIAIGIVISLLVHGLLLYFIPKPIKAPEVTPPPLEVRLTLPPPPPPPPVAKNERAQLKPKLPLPQKATKPTEMVAEKLVPEKPPENPNPQKGPPSEQPQSMAEMVARRQAARAADEAAWARYNAEGRAAAGDMTAAEKRSASLAGNIASLTEKEGGGGVFNIKGKGQRTATFTFQDRTSDGMGKTHTIEVDAGLGGDVELAIIRGVIKVIREGHKGDFSWESQRLGRVILMSARPEDDAQLERFLMIEFGFRKPR